MALPVAGRPGPRPHGVREQLVGTPGSARCDPDPRRRPPRRRLDERCIRQHALHADRQLRSRRLRRERHRDRCRRRGRAGRDRPGDSGCGDRRPHRPTAGDRRRGLARPTAVGPGRSGAVVRRTRGNTDRGPPDGDRARFPGRSRRVGGDATQQPDLCGEHPRHGSGPRGGHRRDGVESRRPRRRRVAIGLPPRRHLVHRCTRPRSAPSGDPAVHRRPHRGPHSTPADEPAPTAVAQLGRVRRQHLRGAGEPLPEQLPQRHPRVLRRDDRGRSRSPSEPRRASG